MATKPKASLALFHPRHWLTWLMIGLWWLLVQLPYPVLCRIGAALGKILYRIGGSRRRIVERNLELCFPELSAEDRETLAKENFISYGMAVFEVPIAWWWSDKRLDRIFHTKGLEHLHNLNGQGALLMASHFTHLELGGQAIARHLSIDLMYRQHNSPVYEFVQSRGRMVRSPDSQVFGRHDVRGVTKALLRGRIVWYAPDQDHGSRQSVFAPFFGIEAATVTATAGFARIGKARVVPFTHSRREDGRGYDIEIHPPLENFPCGDDLADATRINALIEKFIRQHPDQYLWAHRRFKTRPSGEPSLYKKPGE